MVDKIIFLAVIIVACVLAYLLYRDCFGLLICGIGAFLNLLVMAANGWRMPVKVNRIEDYMNIAYNLNNRYIVFHNNVKLAFLADIMRINNFIISAGDIIILIGIILTIMSLVAEIIGFIGENRVIKEQ